MDAIERVGTWWIPQAPRKRIPGRLTFNVDGGIRVELDGGIGDLSGEGTVLLGLCGGTKYTLLDAVSVDSTLSLSRGKTIHQTITATLGYEGQHFRAPEKIVLSLISLRVSRLEQWLGARTFSEEWDQAGYRLTWNPPPEFVREVDGISLAIRSFLGTGWEYPNAPSFEESARIELTSLDRTGLPWSVWRETYVNPMQDLVTLATDRATSVVELRALTPTQLRRLRDRRPLDSTGRIFYVSRGGRAARPERLMPGQMLFSLEDMRNMSPSFVDSWLPLRRRLSVVLDLFLSSIYSEEMYLENRFLNFVQAGEIIHRMTMPNKVMPAADHRRLIKRIFAAVDPTDGKWLKDQLAQSNEPRLARRIEELARSVGEPAISIFGPDVAKFARLVRSMRNDVTHGNKTSGEFDYASMWFFTECLRLILQSLFLREMGVSGSDIETLLTRTTRYGRLLRWSATRALA